MTTKITIGTAGAAPGTEITRTVQSPVSAILIRALGKPSELRLLLPQGTAVAECGAEIRLYADGKPVYAGRVWTVSVSKGLLFVRAFDNTQYLNGSAGAYLREGKRLSDVFRDAAIETGLVIGVCDPSFRVQAFREYDSVTYAKILADSIYDELLHTRREYVVYDDLGRLCMRDTTNLKLPLTIRQIKDDFICASDLGGSGNSGLVNCVLARKRLRRLGVREVYTAADSASIAKYGKMSRTVDVGEYENTRAAAENLCALRGRETVTAEFTCAGDTRVREGCTVGIDAAYRGGTVGGNIAGDVAVTEVTHTFEEGYTMKVRGRLLRS